MAILRFNKQLRVRPGQSLIEILLAIAVFLVGASTIAALVYGAATTQRYASEHGKAVAFAREGIEAARAIRDAGYSGITGGTHGVVLLGGVWNFSGTSDTNDGFTRTITVSTSTPDYAAVTSTVAWSFTPTQTATVTLASMLTNWHKVTSATGTSWQAPIVAATTTLPTNIPANAVAVRGNYLYVAAPNNVNGPEFFVYDITNPDVPSLVGSLELGTTANMIDISGNYAYIASNSQQHEIIVADITNPANPLFFTTIGLSGSANVNGIVADGSILYFVRDRQGNQPTLFAYDVSTPSAPTQIGAVYLGNGGHDLVLVPGSIPYLYLATAYHAGEFETVNIANPANLAVGGRYDAAGVEPFTAVAVSGTNAYAGSSVRASGQEFFTLNTANPLAPSLLGSFPIGATINRMRTRGPVPGAASPENSLVFLATSSSTGQFIVMDVSNPVSPQKYSQILLPGNATSLAVTTSTAYVTTDNPNAGLMILSAQ